MAAGCDTPSIAPPLLSVNSVSKRFGAVTAVDRLSLTVERGEIFGLLGPSGCGKTTVLRLIVGLETPDEGHVELAGRDIRMLPPEQRGFGMVFQKYALFSNKSVFDNIAFGLTKRTRTPVELREKVERLLDLFGLSGYSSKIADKLSAGEQQRVAIARAIAIEPPVLLLDEPLANLDARLRRHAGKEIRDLVRRLNIATVFVTHDQSEAFTLCNRIAIMNRGRVLQAGSPLEIYEHPCDHAVAQFLGFNVVAVKRVGKTHCGEAEFELLQGGWRLHVRSESCIEKDPGFIGIRPEDIHISAEPRGIGNSVQATISDVSYEGSVDRITVDICGNTLEVVMIHRSQFSRGNNCIVEIDPRRLVVCG